MEMMCRTFVVDLSGLNREEKERVLDAVKGDAARRVVTESMCSPAFFFMKELAVR